MNGRMLAMAAALALALAGCDQGAQKADQTAEGPTLDAPTQDADPLRVFTPANPAATTATGELRVALTTRMPDSDAAEGAAATDVLTLTGATGLIVEAELTGVATPATQIAGQTLRARLGLPVEVAQTFLYRIARETKPESGQGLCGADAVEHVIVWESEDPGAPALKVLGLIGGAPGSANLRACEMLDYRRS